ncbi:hypothetical protein HanRHA438_Chr05g0210711 [Helianthus annuus]|uniref:DUF4283 domain-containing protein n=1 Tax=Helianthus annuus TaxID=4232 RepID=A0A9K3IXW2_HELAN|nr:hypothetical protein HanXRQr2_Chr05g0200901 [Helianthus annuus]KAJ0569339.1 hypothetical protein HanHA300_Chr05g0165001 [Helianthus annuus]KAJ0583650.1 hypothetical protein HanHA89_Chr05g0179061 [Helianthus annuus]KAJ0917847.1 hypothetical protein HanRHA438_Chr05g0210711 [Helianthus annuus]
MRIAKIDYTRIQYLGGLTILISFFDKAAAIDFLEAKNVWEPWFSKLEGWNGQSFHLERVAWLKLTGIPLHLLEPDMLSQIGALFGKVLHVPKSLEEEHDISFCRVGILAGEADRINEVVTIKWKSRLYRIRVEEELDVWNPDCLGVPVRSFSDTPSPMMSSPVIGHASSGSKELNGQQQECESTGGGGVSVAEEVDSHAMEIPMHGERENDGARDKEVGGRKTFEMEGNPKVVDPVGPGCGINFNPCASLGFNCNGVSANRSSRRPTLGFKSRKSKAQGSKEASPVDLRPKKRPRGSVEAAEVGFGFVGFTSRSHICDEDLSKPDEGKIGGFDLNTSGDLGEEHEVRLGSLESG